MLEPYPRSPGMAAHGSVLSKSFTGESGAANLAQLTKAWHSRVNPLPCNIDTIFHLLVITDFKLSPWVLSKSEMAGDGANPKGILRPAEKGIFSFLSPDSSKSNHWLSLKPINSIFRKLKGKKEKKKKKKANHNLTHDGKDCRFPMSMLAKCRMSWVLWGVTILILDFSFLK